ncbi:MAG: hypothetical protein KDI06_16650, partial [Calditrichaeota bacterium]|nr:hypothetical protein [Calditrichota bacterium]
GAEVAAPAGHWARVNTVSVSADDRFLVSGAGDGNILIWDRHSGHQLRRIHAHRGAVRDLSFARTDGGDYLLFSAGADGTLKSFRWHSDSLAALADFRETEHPEISRPRHSLSSLAVQQDSALLALGWEDGRLDVQAYFPQAEQTHLVLLGTSRLHQHAVESLAFNPRRGQLASGDGSGNVILWTVNHQDSLWPNLRWAAHERGVSALAFHPRKNMLATGGEDDDIRLWSLGGLRDYQAFAPDEEEGITFGLRRTTRYIFNSRSVQELRKIGVSDSLINALNNPAFRDRAFYGEQNYWDALEKQAGNLDLVDNYRYVLLKYTSRNEVQRMTDFHPRSGRNSVIDFLEILTGHEDDIYALAFSADGQLLASASGDETIRLWNVNAASEIISLEGHQDNVHDLAFLHDQHNRILASASWDCTVRLWDALEGATLDTLIANEVPVRQLAFSPNGRYLLSAGEEGVLNRWTINHRGDAVDKNFRIIGGSILLSLAFDPKGDHFALGSKDNFVRQASVEDMRTATLPRQLGDVLSVAYNVRRFGPENTHYLLAAASSDSTLRIWDYRKKVLLVEKKVHKDKVRSVAFSPRGNLLATGGSDRMVYIWRLVQQNGKFDLIREYSYDDHNSGVWSVAFSPDGNTVASGSWDNTIHLWNFRTDRSRRLIGHRGPVLTVAFSPDGRRLASGSWDQTVRLWDTRSGGELDVITSHRGPVSSVAFSPDGKSLASGSRDRTIRLRHLNYLSSFAVNNKKQVESQIREARREGNMSARLRDLEYLALDSAFVAENQSFRLLDYAGDIYSDLLSQEWHNPTALRQAPTRFYLSVEDTALPVFKTHSSSLANTPRPVEVGPLQWVLESMPEGEKEKRRRRQAKSYWNNVWEDIWRRRGE